MRSVVGMGVVVGVAVWGAVACGSTEISVGSPLEDAGLGADGAVDGASLGDAASRADGAATACIPQGGADEPDDGFADTDCDGVDGAIARALFVATSGPNTGDGSPERPFSSFAMAMAEAQRQGRDVYACAGTHRDAALAIAASVRVFGGYACDGTRRPGRSAATTTFESTAPRAVNVTGAQTTVLFDRIGIAAAPGTTSEPSSIALFLRDARVEMRHATIAAGAGAKGADGPVVVVDPLPLPSGEAGEDVFTPTATQLASGTDYVVCNAFSSSSTCTREVRGGGRRGPNVLQSCRVKGGDGGDGSASPGTAPKAGSAGEGAGGSGGTAEAPNGGAGQRGSAGSNGASASRGFGLSNDSGYVADDDGVAGTGGGFGGGGGGGLGGRSYTGVVRNGVTYTSEIAIGAGGGQGGCGGAGGIGGAAGRAGGASLGVVARRGTLVLRDVRVEAKAGGAGGRGAPGSSGMPGSSGGAGGHGSCAGCYANKGGDGASGGNGGAGGGGGGGPSIALVEDGVVLTLDTTVLVAGAGGVGGANGSGASPGRTGRAAERVAVGADGRAP
jgi:hypothetical protein